MGNALETPSLDFHTMQRGADTHGVLDQATYQPILKTYLESLHILNTESATEEIDFSCRNYKEILFRQRVLQYVWPQCVGIPMLSFQISSDYGVDWWIGVFKPLLDIMLEQVCQLDRDGGVFVLLGWTDTSTSVMGHQTLLYFNAKTKKQIFFDPMHWYNDIMHQKQMATGYQPMVCVQLYEPMQQTIDTPEETANNKRDTCSVLCTLMYICCRRFGTSDLQGIAEMLQAVFLSQSWSTISTIRRNLWVLYYNLGESVKRGAPIPSLFRSLGLISNDWPQCTAAGARRKANGSKIMPCGIASCPKSVYCPYHRLRLLSPNGMTRNIVNEHDTTKCNTTLSTTRPVAPDLSDTYRLMQNTFESDSSWTPPGALGTKILKQKMKWEYIHIDQTLESCGLTVLDNIIHTGECTHMYVRITGFVTNQMHRVENIIRHCLTAAAGFIDGGSLVLDVACTSVNCTPPTLCNLGYGQAFINMLSKLEHLHTTLILWNNEARFLQTKSLMLFAMDNIGMSVEYLHIADVKPLESIDLLKTIKSAQRLSYIFVELNSFHMLPFTTKVPNRLLLLMCAVMDLQKKVPCIAKGAIIRIFPLSETTPATKYIIVSGEQNIVNEFIWPGRPDEQIKTHLKQMYSFIEVHISVRC